MAGMGHMKDLLATVYAGGDEAVAAVERIGKDWREQLEQAASEIERLRGERRWIPVSERLPGPETFAIVATKDGVCEALYGLGGIESPNDPPYWNVNDYGEVWPTHWMPLPRPPPECP